MQTNVSSIHLTRHDARNWSRSAAGCCASLFCRLKRRGFGDLKIKEKKEGKQGGKVVDSGERIVREHARRIHCIFVCVCEARNAWDRASFIFSFSPYRETNRGSKFRRIYRLNTLIRFCRRVRGTYYRFIKFRGGGGAIAYSKKKCVYQRCLIVRDRVIRILE